MREYLEAHRKEIIQEGLSDPQMVARLQAEVLELGLGSAVQAEIVDEDATRKETEDDGRDA